jgi:hypothetical protein
VSHSPAQDIILCLLLHLQTAGLVLKECPNAFLFFALFLKFYRDYLTFL